MKSYARYSAEEIAWLKDKVEKGGSTSDVARRFLKKFKPPEYPERSYRCVRRKAKAFSPALGSRAYTPAEIEFIEERAGTMPTSALIRSFQHRFSKPPYHKRTKAGLGRKITEIAGKIGNEKSYEDYFSPNYLADLFGVCHKTVGNWIKAGLPAKKIAGNTRKRTVRAEDLKQFVLKKPELFRDANKDILYWLLEDRKLVEQIRSTAPRPNRPKRVKRLSDGAVFPSISAASKVCFLDRRKLKAIAESRQFALGSLWQLV